MSCPRTVVEVSCDRYEIIEVGTVIGGVGGGDGGGGLGISVDGKLRIKKQVAIDDMLFPTPQRSFDGLGRLQQTIFEYPSIVVTYDISWVGDTNTLDTYTQTVVDNV